MGSVGLVPEMVRTPQIRGDRNGGRIRPSDSTNFLAVAQFDLATFFIDSLPEDVLELKGGTLASMMISDSQQRNARFLTDSPCSPILP